MTSKRANLLFLTMILTHIGVVLILSFFGERIKIGIITNFFLGEAVLMAPALLFLLYAWYMKPMPGRSAAMPQPQPNGFAAMPQPMPDRPAAVLQSVRPTAFRRVRISTLLMIALTTILLMPFVTVLNTLTLFFTDNAVAAIEGDILRLPFPVMLFMIGIFGPFCEEFVFRGIIYGSYAEHGGLPPILLSAFTFGLMHMNFNQAVYAFAIGILLAFLAEAAGSLWASVFCHMFFNSMQVVMMYLSKVLWGSAYAETVREAAGALTNEQLQAGLAVYLVIAAVTTPIAGCCIAWIAKNEGRQEALRALFHPASGGMAKNNAPGGMAQKNALGAGPRREPLLTVPLVVAVVICFGYMSLEFFL